MEDHFATFATSTRTDVDDVVGIEHHVAVVLDDDDGVAQVAQLLERADETVVVALVQTDARLVENVEHVDQLRTNLCSQTDALTLTTGEAGRLAVQRQVVETHVQQEVQTDAYLFENLCRYLSLLVVEVFPHLIEPLAQFAEVHSRQLGDVLVPHLIRQCLAVEALAVAFRTLALGQKLLGPLLRTQRRPTARRRRAVVIVHDGAQILDDTVVVDEIVAGGVYQILVDAYRLNGAIEYLVEGIVRDVLNGCLQVAVVVAEDGRYLPENHLVFVLAQRHDATLVDGQLAVGNNLGEVYLVDVAQSLATRTGSLR